MRRNTKVLIKLKYASQFYFNGDSEQINFTRTSKICKNGALAKNFDEGIKWIGNKFPITYFTMKLILFLLCVSEAFYDEERNLTCIGVSRTSAPFTEFDTFITPKWVNATSLRSKGNNNINNVESND